MTPEPNLDWLDTRIVDELQKDARIPLRDLADILGVAASTCSERIRRLQRRAVITGFHADVDLDALGRPVQALVTTQVRPLNRQLIEQFREDVLSMPEVMAVFVLAGGDDFLLHVGVRDVNQLHSFIVDKLSTRREVTQFRSSLIFTHGRKRSIENLCSNDMDEHTGRALPSAQAGARAGRSR
jgi:DNA-binding Lrp family transcriptional regulator